MKEIFELVNKMQAAALDVDIFVALPSPTRDSLVTLSPIYDYVRSHGGTVPGLRGLARAVRSGG